LPRIRDRGVIGVGDALTQVLSWMRSAIVSGALASCALAFPDDARADDLFEIQVFHVRVNEPGQFGTELHSNYVASGAPREAPELSANHVLYEMLEPTLGLTKNWEVGAHFQAALRPSGLEWGGMKLRTMVVAPTPEDWPLKFGVNFEGGYVPPEYDPGAWIFEVRPIAEARWGDFDFDVNPIFTVGFDGPSAGVPRFEPAAAVRYTVLETVDLGLEYYAAFGPLDRVAPVSKQGQYVFETVDLVRWPAWRARIGVGEGLTSGSNTLTFTSMIGHFF
jgi:hypothetical protein